MKPRLLSILLSPPILLLFQAGQLVAQAPQHDDRPRTASIAGLVTVGGAPAANALVTVTEDYPRPGSEGGQLRQPAIKVRTDGDGRYRVSGLAEGAYTIRALSKAYVRSKNSSDFDALKSVKLDEGEALENLDLALVRGGVITGRVIDAEGRPLIASQLRLLAINENREPKSDLQLGNQSIETDDRGIYRIYGLPEGRYLISAGGDSTFNRPKHKYPITFYPETTDQSLAKIIEVREGTEATGIDIRLAAEENTYEANGRVIGAESGQPLARVEVVCLQARNREQDLSRFGGSVITDNEGKFRIYGLSAGRYELYLQPPGLSDGAMGNNDFYSEKIRFEVSDSDAGGLEIKAIHGSSISGRVIVEGDNDPAGKTKLQQMQLIFSSAGERESDDADNDDYISNDRGARIAADGGFRIGGVTPGRGVFILSGPDNTYSIKRIERDGAEIRGAFVIGRGESIGGIRVVTVPANGTIRGQVEIAGGRLPEGWELDLSADQVGTESADDNPYRNLNHRQATVDRKGQFIIEGLAAGEYYEVTLSPMVRSSQNEWNSAPGTTEVKQRIYVKGGGETPVKFTLDLPPGSQEKRQ